jgi:hypothetical protein
MTRCYNGTVAGGRQVDKAGGALGVEPAARFAQPSTLALETATQTDLEANAVSADSAKRNNPLTTGVNGLQRVEDRGFEPLTFWLPARRSPN